MNEKRKVRVSKKVSLHLRHAPDDIGITLGPGGWVRIDDLLRGLARRGFVVERAELDEVVATSDKQRFGVDETGTMIRANQGHTVEVDLDLPISEPPAVLYHGTPDRFVPAIEQEGLVPMARHHVHLSSTVDTAAAVGNRRGKGVVLRVDAAAMVAAGHEFRVSANGVWLTDHVPPAYLSR